MAPYRSKSLLSPTTQQGPMVAPVRGSLRASGGGQWCHVRRSLHGTSRCLLTQLNDQLEVQGALCLSIECTVPKATVGPAEGALAAAATLTTNLHERSLP